MGGNSGGNAGGPPVDPFKLPMNAIQPRMGMDPTQMKTPNAFKTALGKAGKYATAWDQAGQQMQQQQQQPPPSQPVNFNIPAQQYIPPPQPMNNPFGMSNAFYGG